MSVTSLREEQPRKGLEDQGRGDPNMGGSGNKWNSQLLELQGWSGLNELHMTLWWPLSACHMESTDRCGHKASHLWAPYWAQSSSDPTNRMTDFHALSHMDDQHVTLTLVQNLAFHGELSILAIWCQMPVSWVTAILSRLKCLISILSNKLCLAHYC